MDIKIASTFSGTPLMNVMQGSPDQKIASVKERRLQPKRHVKHIFPCRRSCQDAEIGWIHNKNNCDFDTSDGCGGTLHLDSYLLRKKKTCNQHRRRLWKCEEILSRSPLIDRHHTSASKP